MFVRKKYGTGDLFDSSATGCVRATFLHDFRTWAYSNLKAGNLYIREVSTYKEQLDYLEYGSGVTNKYRMNIILAVFFLINLALGVTGAFWLQTRSAVKKWELC